MTMAHRPLAMNSRLPRTGAIVPRESGGLITISFSTEELAEADRVAMWRDHYGRTALRVEIEPAAHCVFDACVLSRILPDMHLLLGTLSPARITRTRELVADANDDLALIINRYGTATVSARGRELQMAPGDAVLTSSADVMVFERERRGESLSIRMSRPTLAALVRNVDDAIMHPMHQQSEVLKLLAGYAASLITDNGLAAPGLRQVAVGHLHDLLSMALGGSPHMARSTGEGLRAARLRSAKGYIARHSARHDIGIGAVAAHLGVTIRYLQRLFEADGSTFSGFLLNQRLANAYRMLCELQFSDLPVSAIAYDVGFSDLSYFNRTFRRRYDATPSDVREARVQSKHAIR